MYQNKLQHYCESLQEEVEHIHSYLAKEKIANERMLRNTHETIVINS